MWKDQIERKRIPNGRGSLGGPRVGWPVLNLRSLSPFTARQEMRKKKRAINRGVGVWVGRGQELKKRAFREQGVDKRAELF